MQKPLSKMVFPYSVEFNDGFYVCVQAEDEASAITKALSWAAEKGRSQVIVIMREL